MADQVGFRLAQTTFGSIHGLVQPAAVQVTPVQTVPYYSLGLQARFPAQLFKGAETLPEISQYADVGYEYDEQKHLRRTEARLQAGCLRTDLPTGWPRALSGPLVWTGSDYADESLFVYTLSDSDNAEILDALRHFKGKPVVILLGHEYTS
ncbi:hypothetical protein BHE90_001482 [Fusarium euwallaceae]|uniref:Uncharacterized protein n=1 Tax=Fusarium euwallaceae TaxID=1147111 RepID=A0A430M7Q0_9HYPO|nr:hypothetical protein BHE90_001482 [Fusarium euwallaceae]